MLSLSLDLNEEYRLTIGEMSRKSHLALSTWYNDWLTAGGDNLKKLTFVSAISTQVILYSRLTLYRKGEKQPDGTYEIEEGFSLTLPLTEAGLNDLPLSLSAWLIDAAGRIHPHILETFLAAARRIAQSGKRIQERLSASGQLDRSIPN